MARSLNRVELIGNLTRDPELRYTPQGTAVCTFGVATNRAWVLDSGEKKEDVEFHRIVAWNKLAELCSQLLSKGRKVFVEGRLQTRSWTGQDGAQRTITEIVINDMLILDSKRQGQGYDDGDYGSSGSSSYDEGVDEPANEEEEKKAKKSEGKKSTKKKTDENESEGEDINPDDIPF